MTSIKVLLTIIRGSYSGWSMFWKVRGFIYCHTSNNCSWKPSFQCAVEPMQNIDIPPWLCVTLHMCEVWPWSVGTWDWLFWLLRQAQPLNVVHWVCLMLLKLVYSLRKCVNQLSSPATSHANWPMKVKKIKLQIFCKICVSEGELDIIYS